MPNRGQHVQLWGGPEDGATLWMPPGDLPARVGAHRTLDDALVPIRGRALHVELEHVQVYERCPVSAIHGWLRMALPGIGDGRCYVHRDVLTRWAARGQE